MTSLSRFGNDLTVRAISPLAAALLQMPATAQPALRFYYTLGPKLVATLSGTELTQDASRGKSKPPRA